MDGNSSCDEDFSEAPVFTEDEPKVPEPIKPRENSAFEILSVDKIVQNVFDMIRQVQNFLSVSAFVELCNGFVSSIP